MKLRHILLFAVLVACGEASQAGEDRAAELALTMVAQTADAIVLEATAPPPTTAPTAIPPTNTPGPIFFSDDFSEDTGNWLGCEVCRWDEGGLIVGPHDEFPFGEPKHVICSACGNTSNYRMAIDATFYEGMSGGGFGFLLYEDDESALEYRISVWQIAGLDHTVRGEVTVLVGVATSLIKPSLSTNRLEVIVKDSPVTQRSDIRLMVNDKTIQVYLGSKSLRQG